MEQEKTEGSGEAVKHTAAEGLRFNEGKLRYDLLHPVAQEGIVQVLTFGARKYTLRNWEKGMKWSNVISSLKRHLAAIEKGEDFDSESQLLHIDHIQCNAHFLSAYYKIYPQGDDRPVKYQVKRIALDIDEVLADFTGGWAQIYADIPPRPITWNYDKNMKHRFEEMKKADILDDFYSKLECKVSAAELSFEPICYVTSRPVESKVTETWLAKHGFPAVPVLTVGVGQSKVDAIKNMDVDIFVDDCYKNFVEVNKAGIFTYLFDAPHNRRYNVGHKRIFNLNQVA